MPSVVTGDATNETEIVADGSLRIPRVDCTHDAFFQYLPQLRIRDLLAWGLRTETKVRLSKIERRLGTLDNEENDGYSKVLKSDYLIDIYPVCDTDDSKDSLTPMGHDEYKFSRKAHPNLTFIETESEDFDGLTPIKIEKKISRNKRKMSQEDGYGYASGDSENEDEDEKSFAQRKVVPPTLLHFEIILEAYMGYNLGVGCSSSYYNSPDNSLPRAAIMGGAVVAALTSFQDKFVVESFENSDLFNDEGGLQEERIYWGAKIALIKQLHNHFICSLYHPCSLYAKGDVDIFLQPSPLTQGVTDVLLRHGIGPEQIDMIASFVGKSDGLREKDLARFVTNVIKEGGVDYEEGGVIAAPHETSFAFTMSKHAVSFILGKADWYDHYDTKSFDETIWPRTSQFIMLDSRADLLGGLLDFDQSIVACSYNGISVQVAPRAALSLMTNANFVTPFCFEEPRNKKRVIKYARRGFRPFLIDPNDNGNQQIVACDANISSTPFIPTGHRRYDPEYLSATREITEIQETKMESKARMFCCHILGPETYPWDEAIFQQLGSDSQKRKRCTNVPYTMKMFETSPDDAIDFFKKRFSWSDDEFAIVQQIDPYLRMACRKCKDEYNLIRVVMPKYPELMKQYGLDDDNLRTNFLYKYDSGVSFYANFQPCFYSGTAFDSSRVRDNARPTYEILSVLHAQSIFEVCAYVMKHGSPDNYKKRFVHGSDLRKTFGKAWMTPLQEPARPPIGLNPERFVERCGQCRSWLLGNMYGSTDCQQCS